MLKQMRCGGCGAEEHRVFTTARDNGGPHSAIVLECCKCKSTTVVGVSAVLLLDFPSNSPLSTQLADGDGCLAIFENQ